MDNKDKEKNRKNKFINFNYLYGDNWTDLRFLNLHQETEYQLKDLELDILCMDSDKINSICEMWD